TQDFSAGGGGVNRRTDWERNSLLRHHDFTGLRCRNESVRAGCRDSVRRRPLRKDRRDAQLKSVIVMVILPLRVFEACVECFGWWSLTWIHRDTFWRPPRA